MEKNKKMIIIASLGIAMILLIGWIFFNSKTDLENAKIKQAKEELKEYQAEILASANGYNPEDYTEETMKKELIETVAVAQNNYAGDSVGVYALDIQTTINGFTGTAEEILNQTIAFLEELDVNGIISKVVANNVEPTKTLTLKSTTVCETEEIEKEYCLDGETTKLSANVYVHDQQSTKWVVLLHPAMMNGSVMYGALGEIYKEKGYNVLAPDSRGFGNSDGEVALGYLESLDVYDWIKDLHYNYKERYGVNNQPDTIIIHGISLGATTTLQLATNPDIAASEDNLTKLGVKGFFEDSGHVSMNDTITELLANGDMGSLTILLSSLGIDFEKFMSELQTSMGASGVTGLENFDVNSIKGLEEFFLQTTDFVSNVITAHSEDIKDASNTVKDKLKEYLPEDMINSMFDYVDDVINSGNTGTLPTLPTLPINPNDITSQMQDYYNCLLENAYDYTKCKMPSATSTTSATNNYGAFDFAGFLNSIVNATVSTTSKVTNTFSKYDNSISSERDFPSDSKVVVVENKTDTTVPPNDGDKVAEKADDNLYYEYETEESIIPTENEEYEAVVDGFTDCVEGKNCEEPKLENEKNNSSKPNKDTGKDTSKDTSDKKQPTKGVIKDSKIYISDSDKVSENYSGECRLQEKETTSSTSKKIYYEKWNYNKGKYEKVNTTTNGIKYINKSKVDGKIKMQWYITVDGKKYYTDIYERNCTEKNSEIIVNDKYIENVHSKYKTKTKTKVNVEESILITTANYQVTLKDYNNSSKVKKNIKSDIKSKYIYTAPHSVIHWREDNKREDNYKVADVYTDVICETLAKLNNSVCISRTAYDKTDPNYDSYEKSEFQKLVVDIVNEKKLNYLVDIHGLANGKGFDFAIGTRKGNTLQSKDQCNLEKKLANSINNYASGTKVSLNEYSKDECEFKKLKNETLTTSFTGGNVVVNVKNNVSHKEFSAVQIEISNDYRTKTDLVKKTINAIHDFANSN